MKIKIKFEPRDTWVGVYWNKELEAKKPLARGQLVYETDYKKVIKFYICIIPCFPVIISHDLRTKA